jgi:hypothetical protein
LPPHRVAILSKPAPAPGFPSMPAVSSLDSVLIPRSPVTLCTATLALQLMIRMHSHKLISDKVSPKARDMLLGALITIAGLWFIGIALAICYIVFRV